MPGILSNDDYTFEAGSAPTPVMTEQEALEQLPQKKPWVSVAADTYDPKEHENDELISSLVTGKKPSSPLCVNYNGEAVDQNDPRLDPYKIKSNSNYKILGVEDTPNGARVYVDQNPTRSMTDEEKHQAAQTAGTVAGVGSGAVAGVGTWTTTGGMANPWSGPLAGAAALGTYDAVAPRAQQGTQWVLDKTNPNIPISEQNGATYVGTQ
jgi:hypothetical protein